MEDSNGTQASTTADVSALTAVVQALKALPRESHRRVIDAALVLLGNPPSAKGPGVTAASVADLEGTPTDIRRLAELKQPKSASEMAALVAYYLAETADPRKGVVENADMVKYFKQARFKLPGNPAMILVNAKNAGYIDSTGAGQYRLNPVGYNLVVHSLPRSDSAAGAPKNRNRPRRNSRKTGRKP